MTDNLSISKSETGLDNFKVEVDLKQIRGLVSERNMYLNLLKKCQTALSLIPNTHLNIEGTKNTYSLTLEIDKVLSEK